MSMANKRLVEEVFKFVHVRCGTRRGQTLDFSTRLREDLGLYGEDSYEFFTDFTKCFDVDFSDMEIHRHFNPEWFDFKWLLFKPVWWKDLGRYPVTIGHLIQVAEAGRWFMPPPVKPTDA